MNELESIKRHLATMGKRTPAFRYPEPLRQRIIALVRQRRTADEDPRRIAASLDIPWVTMERWLLSQDITSQALVPVHVIEDEASRQISVPALTLSLVTPRGYRLEGLDLEQAYALLGRLG